MPGGAAAAAAAASLRSTWCGLTTAAAWAAGPRLLKSLQQQRPLQQNAATVALSGSGPVGMSRMLQHQSRRQLSLARLQPPPPPLHLPWWLHG